MDRVDNHCGIYLFDFADKTQSNSLGRSSGYKFLFLQLNLVDFHETILQPLDGAGLQACPMFCQQAFSQPVL
jgi:hypothetical protein